MVNLGYSKGSINDSDEDFDVFVISYQQLVLKFGVRRNSGTYTV